MTEPRRVLLVGRDELALGGLARLLAEVEGAWVASDIEEEADAAILDFGEGTSVEALPSLSDRIPVLALAADAKRSREALALGARGVLSRKSTAARLARALDAVVEGLVVLDEDFAEEALRPPSRPLGSEEELTPREVEVLESVALGLSNKEIAARLHVSFHTVKFHVNSILGKLGASSRTEAVAMAARSGILRF